MVVTPPYAHAVNRVTISGTCFNGNEIWNTGFYLGASGTDAPDPEGHAALIEPFWTAFFAGSGNAFSNVYKTTQIKVAQMKTDGKVDIDKIDYYTYGTALAGASAAVPLPPQVTLAGTITSDVQRGLGAKGRMYLPGVNMAIDTTTGKLSSSNVGAMADDFKTFLDGVHQPGGALGALILASHGHAIKDPAGIITGYTGPINVVATGCRVGDVYDTQRRRRDGLIETYSARVLAP